MHRSMRPLFVIAMIIFMAMIRPVSGEVPLASPTSRIVLTVNGSIERTNAEGRAVFDRDMLRQLGMTRVVTSTSWTSGTPEFEGVLARDVLQAVGASGESVLAIAINDYEIEIPISDFEKYPVLFALEMDGVELTTRDKGPIWIVYPRDEYEIFRDQKTDEKWLWQLVEITVR